MSEPVHNKTASSHDALIQAYLDGEITPEEENTFNRLLSEPEFRRRLTEYAIDAAALHELGEQNILGLPLCASPPSPRLQPFRPRLVAFGMAVSLVVAVVYGILVFEGENRAIDGVRLPIGTVTRIEGRLTVGHEGKLREVEQNSAVHDNDTILVHELTGLALLEMNDGTELNLTGDTKLTGFRQHGQTRITVHEGHLSAHVMPQPPAKPLVIITPNAEIQVLGTSLAVSADATGSELAVQQGRVRIKRLSDGRSIEVGSGQFAVASSRSQLVARPWPVVGDEWEAGFEAGLPEGWRFGQWMNEGLPAGSRGAVRAARWFALDGHESALYRITSPKEWTRGLFRITADSTLHFYYKMERPGWFHIMMGTRSNGFAPVHVGNYEWQDAQRSKTPLGQWRKVSVPLASFRKTVQSGLAGERAGNPPREGDVAYLLWFSTADRDCGLVIDRIWISGNNQPST